MADLKPISAFNAASAVDANTLFLVSTPNGADYDSENASAALVADAVVNDFEYTQDLSTVSKKVTGAINENKSVIGYSYDEYDDTTAYSKDDLCIYNNTLYKAKQATTGNLPTNTTYWEQTSIADAINELKANNTQEYNTLTSAHLTDDMLYSRNGKQVTISCQTTLNTAINAGDTLVLYTIGNSNNRPIGIKPSTTFISGGKVGMVRIDNISGDITLYNQSGANLPVSSAINFIVTFFAQG